MGVTAVVLPFVVVPVRKSLGFDVSQYTKRADDV